MAYPPSLMYAHIIGGPWGGGTWGGGAEAELMSTGGRVDQMS